MIPQVEFRYSAVYDKVYRNSIGLKKFIKKINQKYPTNDEISQFRNKIEKVWKKEGNNILKKIEEVSGLKWSEDKIVCYVVGVCKPMSDPLTIKVCRGIDHAVDILTHELIHCLQSEINDKKWNRWYNYLGSKYPDVTKTTKSHIFLNAVHMKVYSELFEMWRLKRDMENSKVSFSYRKSWEIVEKEGYNNLIKKFKQITK